MYFNILSNIILRRLIADFYRNLRKGKIWHGDEKGKV